VWRRYGAGSNKEIETGLNLKTIAFEITSLAETTGWVLKEQHHASTGSIYISLLRKEKDKTEYIIVRVATHKQFYQSWVTMFSIAPGDLYFEELEEILTKEFGSCGDIL